jgi:benzylsuccinate CoA-transferase BbsF subunit
VSDPAVSPLLPGLKVLDFTWAAAGPVATTFLSFLGADVVKVEHGSRPDLMRVSDRQYGYGAVRSYDESPLFNELASGKRSIDLDLRQPDDLQLAVDLAAVADVVVENMRPGKFEKLGLSYQRLSELNPRLIMCSVSATGRTSVASPPGYAPVFWAEGGGAWLTGWPDRPPGLVRGPVDLHAAAFAGLGILSLLRRREITGTGGYLDTSAVEAVAAVVGAQLIEAQVAERAGWPEPARRGNEFPGTLVNDTFPCAGEDQWLALTLRDDADVAAFLDLLAVRFRVTISREEILGGDAAQSWKNLARLTESLDVTELEAACAAAGVPAARSTSLRAAMTEPRLTQRHALQSIFHDVLGEQVIIALPWLLDGSSYPVRGPAPVLGGDRGDVLRDWLGTA